MAALIRGCRQSHRCPRVCRGRGAGLGSGSLGVLGQGAPSEDPECSGEQERFHRARSPVLILLERLDADGVGARGITPSCGGAGKQVPPARRPDRDDRNPHTAAGLSILRVLRRNIHNQLEVHRVLTGVAARGQRAANVSTICDSGFNRSFRLLSLMQ